MLQPMKSWMIETETRFFFLKESPLRPCMRVCYPSGIFSHRIQCTLSLTFLRLAPGETHLKTDKTPLLLIVTSLCPSIPIYSESAPVNVTISSPSSTQASHHPADTIAPPPCAINRSNRTDQPFDRDSNSLFREMRTFRFSKDEGVASLTEKGAPKPRTLIPAITSKLTARSKLNRITRRREQTKAVIPT